MDGAGGLACHVDGAGDRACHVDGATDRACHVDGAGDVACHVAPFGPSATSSLSLALSTGTMLCSSRTWRIQTTRDRHVEGASRCGFYSAVKDHACVCHVEGAGGKVGVVSTRAGARGA